MCARFTLRTGTETVARLFEVDEVPEYEPRFNIAPTQPVIGIVGKREGGRKLKYFHWGLVPSWAKDPSIGQRLINARAESLAEKPSFKAAYQRRRCLIPADGFFEWQEVEEPAPPEPEPDQLVLFDAPAQPKKAKPKKTKKQPYYIGLKDYSLFAFAGLWEFWKDERGEPLESCTIITTAPNELIAPMHDRMPAILRPEDYELWLDRDEHDPIKLQPLLEAFPAEEMTAYPVSTVVNSALNESPDCVAPLE